MSRRVAAAAAATLGCALLAAGAARAGGPAALSTRAAYAAGPAVPRDFHIEDPRVTESSGLARSVRHPHVVWTANDSGDSARIFAVDTGTGRTVGVHTFGAPVRDVEALAVTPQGRVLVGDIGDNGRSRDHVTVYWFDEPALGDTTGGWSSWDLVYPDGPHDAESLAVDPRTGRVVVVTKAGSGGVYALPARPSRARENRLVRVGDGPAVATDAVWLADGSALAVRTYTQLVLLDRRTFAVRASALLPLQPQGETLALDPDGPGLLAGSEGRGSLVQRVAVPAPATPAPATPAPATPAPSGTGTTAPTATSTGPSAGGAGTSDRDDAGTRGDGRALGAVAALGTVAAVAGLAAAATLRRRRRRQ
ncbi:hypothetical protein [Phycicoccus sp. 3266]|uniref:hypothetical protein n=1 Tax=Phycicoccus sp. 3266 TaxID=2817751 RepID=UPI002860EA32|nr:hypothetical protein [Phycicoccus sp. 3266]MDR6864293.1 hypothetical protein [Phycicoccus sp. 3266]